MDVDIKVEPMSEINLPNFDIDLPQGLGGEQSITFGVEVAGHNEYNNRKIEADTYWAEGPLFLHLNYDTYRAFVSRSNHPNDVQISDSIQNNIRRWGFETDTLFTDVDDPVSEIVSDAKNADCLFGIAVPRYETLGGESPQFHYLDGEAGMALVREIPVVIFEHEQVDLKGIPKECFRIEFSDPQSDNFRTAFSEVMMLVRETIQNNKQSEFIQKVVKVGGAMGVGALLAGAFSESENETKLE